MLKKLLVLIIIFPFVELQLLVYVNGKMGFLNTLGIIILTGILGAKLISREGLIVFKHIQTELNQKNVPKDSLIEAVIILVSGIFLLTPGFITDAIGIVLVIPFLRKPFIEFLLSRFTKSIYKKDLRDKDELNVSYREVDED